MTEDDEKKLIWEEIEKIKRTIKFLSSAEVTSGNQRLEAFQTLKRYDQTLERVVDGLNLTRQQRDEHAATADERERRWIHELSQLQAKLTDTIIEYLTRSPNGQAVETTTASTAEKIDKDGKVVESTTTVQVQALKTIETLGEALAEASGAHNTHKPDPDEPAHDRSGALASIVRTFKEADLQTKLLLTLLAFLGASVFFGWVFYKSGMLEHTADEEPAPHAVRHSRPVDAGAQVP